jgi:hypothetical protein
MIKTIRDRVLMPLYLLIGFVLIFSKAFNIEKNTFIIIYLVLICLTILVICSILTNHERVKHGLPEEQWNGAKPTNNYQSELMKRKAMQDLKDELNGLPEVICSIPIPKTDTEKRTETVIKIMSKYGITAEEAYKAFYNKPPSPPKPPPKRL